LGDGDLVRGFQARENALGIQRGTQSVETGLRPFEGSVGKAAAFVDGRSIMSAYRIWCAQRCQHKSASTGKRCGGYKQIVSHLECEFPLSQGESLACVLVAVGLFAELLQSEC
jgi:hypothetical protein